MALRSSMLGVRRILKRVIRRMPAKGVVFSRLKGVWIPGFYRSLRFTGPFKLPIDDGHAILIENQEEYGLETEWFWQGILGWERVSIQIWMNLCRVLRTEATSVVVWDIGAAEGVYALVAKALVPRARVIAVEPLAGNLRKLRHNVLLNRLTIDVIDAACSDEDGEALLFGDSCPTSTEASLVRRVDVDRPAPANLVTTRTVDSLMNERNLTSLDLIKIDVEGAEGSVLRGMTQGFQKFRPVILLEILSDSVAQEISELLSGLDYCYYDINDDPRIGECGIRMEHQLRRGACLNWLLVPREAADALAPAWTPFLRTD